MKSIMQEIQSTVIKYATIIERIIEVDVEIVDMNLLTIAGTGADGYDSIIMGPTDHIIEEGDLLIAL